MSGHAEIEKALAARGVRWPLCGFAPGLYDQYCHDCGERHMADKRSLRCLPCAFVHAIEAGEEARGRAFDAGRRAGRAGLLDEIRQMASPQSAGNSEYTAADLAVLDGLPPGPRRPAGFVTDD